LNRIERVAPDPKLLEALKAGEKSVDTNLFPCYSWEYIGSCHWSRQVLIIPYNIIYYGVSAIAKVTKYALLAIPASLYYGVYVPLNFITMGSLKNIYDYICPINPINGEHQFVFPYVFEKFLVEYLFPTDWREEDKTLTELCQDAIKDDAQPFLTHVDDSGPFTKAVSWVYNDCFCPTYGAKKQPKAVDKFSYTVRVLTDEEEMNAFSTLGGEIYINKGLLDKVAKCVDEEWVKGTKIPLPGGVDIELDFSALNRNETVEEVEIDGKKRLKNELIQMVFLHEACHSQSRHNALGLMFACVVKIALAVVDFFFFESSLLKSVIDFYASFRGRWNEHEADIAAAYFANKAGINPLTAIYFQALSLKGHYGQDEERQGDKHLKWFRSHPPASERKRALYAAMETFAPAKLMEAKAHLFIDKTIAPVPYPYPYADDENRSSDGVQWVWKLLKRTSEQLVDGPFNSEVRQID
jgi:hypothetical protein